MDRSLEYMLKDEKLWQVIEKVLMDQFLSTIVNENVKHHLKDQCYQSLSELSRAADNYVAVRKESSRKAIVSRNEYWEPVKNFSVVVTDNVPNDFRNEDRKQDCSTLAYNKPKQESTPRTQKFSFACFKCGQIGQKASECVDNMGNPFLTEGQENSQVTKYRGDPLS